MRVLCFTANREDLVKVSNFVSDSNTRAKSNMVVYVDRISYASFDLPTEEWLFVLRLSFFIPFDLPTFFYKWALWRALKKLDCEIHFIKQNEALSLIINNGSD